MHSLTTEFIKRAQKLLPENMPTAKWSEPIRKSVPLPKPTKPALHLPLLRQRGRVAHSKEEEQGRLEAIKFASSNFSNIANYAVFSKWCHRQIFRMIAKDAGVWKDIDNDIVARAPDGRITGVAFSPIPAAQVEKEMSVWSNCTYQRLTEGFSPLLVSALSVLDFLCIHPFADGNGRVARLVALLLLKQCQIEISDLEPLVHQNKKLWDRRVVQSIQGWHTSEHDVGIWIEYFVDLVCFKKSANSSRDF